MNNSIFDIDLTRTLPPVLKTDPKMQALSKIIAEELQENVRLIRNNIIYARIDELPEKLLDILAYDMHIDWYGYDYPIEVKRELIKTSVRVHKKLGTVYAVETALGALHPKAEVEEWFNYDGEPFYFRINIYIAYSRMVPEIKEIIRVINIYKRLTAHLEKITYKYTTTAKVKSVSVGGVSVTIKVKAVVETNVKMITEDNSISVQGIGGTIKVKEEINKNILSVGSHNNVMTVLCTNIMYISRKED